MLNVTFTNNILLLQILAMVTHCTRKHYLRLLITVLHFLDCSMNSRDEVGVKLRKI